MSFFSLSAKERFDFYEKHEKCINWTFVLTTFLVSCIIFFTLVFVGLDDNAFVACEEIAYSVYNQKLQGSVLYEIPKGYRVSFSETNIIVNKVGLYLGQVELYLVNNEVIVERNSQIFPRVMICIIVSCIMTLILLMFLISYNIKHRGQTKVIRFFR